jgi:hypothetical protein
MAGRAVITFIISFKSDLAVNFRKVIRFLYSAIS